MNKIKRFHCEAFRIYYCYSSVYQIIIPLTHIDFEITFFIPPFVIEHTDEGFY